MTFIVVFHYIRRHPTLDTCRKPAPPPHLIVPPLRSPPPSPRSDAIVNSPTEFYFGSLSGVALVVRVLGRTILLVLNIVRGRVGVVDHSKLR
jgi:hypothetical protein